MTRAAAFAGFLLVAGFAACSGPGFESRTANEGAVILEDVPEVPEEVTAVVERYGAWRSASFGDWTADGGILISTRFANVSQVHRVAVPDGARQQVTFYGEPVTGVTREPGGDRFLLYVDTGGTENLQLLLFDPVTGSGEQITDGRSRNLGAHWSPDGRSVAFTSTRRDGRSNDVWIMPTHDPGAARLVLEAEGGAQWNVTDWSDDGERLLLVESVSRIDSRMFLYELSSGEATLLSGGGSEPSSHIGSIWDAKPDGGPLFSKGGAGVFFASDRFGEFLHLAYMDLGDRSVRVITDGIPWDIEKFTLSSGGDRGAFVANEGGFSRLYLLDPETLEFRGVEALQDGVIGGVAFDPGGNRLAVTFSSALQPSDVYTVELGPGPLEARGVTRWTRSEVGPLDESDFVAATLVHYPTFDGLSIPAWVHAPPGPGPHPVIVQIHGGPESQARPGFSATHQMYVKHLGAAVIEPNVRGSTGYGKSWTALDDREKRGDGIRDLGALLDWIETQPNLDERRVIVSGGSYGGYSVLAALVEYSDRLAGGVNRVGMSNLVSFLENTSEYRRDLRRAEYGDERDPEMRRTLEALSPITRVEQITAPLLVAQGANDPRVPAGESRQIVDALRANGHVVWYMLALNEGHGLRRQENADLWNRISLMFIQRQLTP